MSAERPPEEEDGDRELTSGDPLDAARDQPAPPPWARAEPTEPASPPPWATDPAEAQGAFGTAEPASAADAFGLPEERVGEPEPEAEPAHPPPPPPAPAPRTGSVGPPGYEDSSGYGDRPIPPGAGLPPRPPVAAGVAAPGERRALASWGRRAVAYLLDAVIVGVIVTLLIVLITGAAGGVGFLGSDATGYGALVLGLLFSTLIATAVALLYAPFYMARTNGQTLGKQLMGIRVIRANGQPVDFLWSVLREVVIKAFVFAGLGSSITFGLAWLLDGLWPLWDNENRALHDLIVDSRVVKA